MKSFLLLILSLMAGCEDSDEVTVKGCQGGWVEFTRGYNEYYHDDEETPKETERVITITKRDMWEQKGNISMYHDTTNKKLRVVIKQLQREDFGEYKCKFFNGDLGEKREIEVEVEKAETDDCQGQFNQTAYRTAKTTITCNYPRNRDESDVLFFCKENKITCEDILSTESSTKSNKTFTLTKTNRGFNVSISKVSSLHAGVYWCGVKSNEGSYRAGFRKIQLEVKDITNFTRSVTIGQNFTYWCEYPNGAPIKKFICKGEDPSICEPLVNTMQRNKNTGRFSIEDDKKKRNITITVREVTTDDTGTYWCGAETTNKSQSNPFFHRLSMTVVSPGASTPTSTSPSKHSTSSAMSTTTTTTTVTASDKTGAGGSQLNAIIAVVVCVALLALLLFLVLLYKRREHTKNTRNEEAQNNNEEAAYAEIQEHPHMPGSRTALKTIYTTANFPTNPSSASHDDSNIHTYSTVKDTSHQHPIYSTVNHPSGFSENPFYSTVNNPQQH